MAFSIRKSSSGTGPVGLDLDGSYLAAVQADGHSVSRAVSTELAPGIVSDGEVGNPAALSEALKRFFKEHGLSRRVRLGISNQQVVVRLVEIPLIDDPKDRATAIRFQAAEAIPMPLEEATLDYQVVGDSIAPDGTTQLRVIVVAAREAMITKLLEAVRGAGLKPEGIDLDAFALIRMLASAEEMGYDGARVYCHLGGITNLAIALGTSCLFTRPLSTAWQEDVDHTAAALAEEIRLSIDYYLDQPEAPRVADVLLSGPGSKAEGLADQLSLLMDLPVAVAEPLGHMTAANLPEGEDPARHTVAAGLAIGAAGA